MDKIVEKITQHRNKKGYTFENMANELQITAAAYRKIETGETKLSVERLFKIAKILESPLTDFLDLDKDLLTQHNHDNENVYQQKIDNFYQENQETYKELIKAKDEQIKLLNEQIIFYRENSKISI
ncbi:MAG: XRE family transcriptional regulator [Sphingobacteriia bacterium]|nr:MAG: XRE family transcriptional regulator [Sphingobacteriia bacterium]TAG30984.1 MAG: XRE family transcriptional regulator [Sphingobacteriia bacterium]